MCFEKLTSIVSASLLALALAFGLNSEASVPSLETESQESQESDSITNAPEPEPVWTSIAPKDVHMFEVNITGWTVFSLLAASESPLEIYLFDQWGTPLASFDSHGCGYLLRLDRPQPITVVIVNGNQARNSYFLDVNDS